MPYNKSFHVQKWPDNSKGWSDIPSQKEAKKKEGGVEKGREKIGRKKQEKEKKGKKKGEVNKTKGKKEMGRGER